MSEYGQHSGQVLCPVRPLDKAANANALRRHVDPTAIDTSAMPATGLPPAYLPTAEKDDFI